MRLLIFHLFIYFFLGISWSLKINSGNSNSFTSAGGGGNGGYNILAIVVEDLWWIGRLFICNLPTKTRIYCYQTWANLIRTVNLKGNTKTVLSVFKWSLSIQSRHNKWTRTHLLSWTLSVETVSRQRGQMKLHPFGMDERSDQTEEEEAWNSCGVRTMRHDTQIVCRQGSILGMCKASLYLSIHTGQSNSSASCKR